MSGQRKRGREGKRSILKEDKYWEGRGRGGKGRGRQIRGREEKDGKGIEEEKSIVYNNIIV